MSNQTASAFAVGTGRCGTHFIAKVYAREPAVASSHERYPTAEAFERYCRWYDLPVDQEGFLQLLANGIRSDLQGHDLSFEASAYLSLSVNALYERFGSKFVLMVRRPEAVVNSLWAKGWYLNPYVQGDPNRALGYQAGTRPHHAFSRIGPKGDELNRWQRLTRIGKLAWFWSALNGETLRQLQCLPREHWRLVRLEAFDYESYCDLSAFLGIQPTIPPSDYRGLVQDRPGRRPRQRSVRDWTGEERAEFEEETTRVIETLGYAPGIDDGQAADDASCQDGDGRDSDSTSSNAWRDGARALAAFIGRTRGRTSGD
jgi:hypothetical protein